MTEPARPLRIWVTRAEPGASATAARLRALGHSPLNAPLIATRPLSQPPPELTDVGALAFTSAAGVRAFADLTGDRTRPVFAVGAATAAAAREAGWPGVRDADGDGAALAALLSRDADRLAGWVLAPGPREPAFDLVSALADAGLPARALAVYETAALPAGEAVLPALRGGEVDAVLLQSASAARALDAALPQGPPAPHAPWALALSPACRPTATGWRVRTAAGPRERDLLALLPVLDAADPFR